MATGMRPKWLTDLTQPIPTQALGYASQGPMTNQQAQQFQTASGYMPSVTVGGNYGVNLPTQRAPADFDAKQRSKALTSRMLDPNMNADGRYFQGAQMGVGANGRPAWIDQMAPGNVAGMDAKKRAIFEQMEQQGKGYFDRRTGRFIGASGGTQTPSPQAMATMGNDAAQRTAGIAGRVPSLRPGILDPNIGGTVGGGPLPQATVPDRFSQYTSVNGAQPAPAQSPAAAMLAPTGQAQGAGMDAYRARLAESQKLVTARAQQRGADRRERLAGPDWQEVLAMRNPQWAARMAEINAQQGLAQQGLAWQRENAQMTDKRERYVADQNASVARDNAQAAMFTRLVEGGLDPTQAREAVAAQGGGAQSPAGQLLAPTPQVPPAAGQFFNGSTWKQFAALPIEQQRQQLAALGVPADKRREILQAADPEPGLGMDDITSGVMGRDKYTGDMLNLPSGVGFPGALPVLRWLGAIPK